MKQLAIIVHATGSQVSLPVNRGQGAAPCLRVLLLHDPSTGSASWKLPITANRISRTTHQKGSAIGRPGDRERGHWVASSTSCCTRGGFLKRPLRLFANLMGYDDCSTDFVAGIEKGFRDGRPEGLQWRPWRDKGRQ